MSFDITLTIMSAVAANAVYDLVRRVSDMYKSRSKLNSAKENDFQSALTSESLDTLGNYLDHSLGQFTLSEYAHNREVGKKVDLFIARLKDYIGPESQGPMPATKNLDTPVSYRSVVMDNELRNVEHKLANGLMWDALASLRRIVEVRLRNMAESHKIIVTPKAGAGALLQSLVKTELIPPSIAEALRYSIDIANRGIHGHEVSMVDCQAAFRQSWYALGELGLLQG